MVSGSMRHGDDTQLTVADLNARILHMYQQAGGVSRSHGGGGMAPIAHRPGSPGDAERRAARCTERRGVPCDGGPVRTGARTDSRLVVLNLADRDWSSDTAGRLVFDLRLSGGPRPSGGTGELRVDEPVRNCSGVEPVALFLPSDAPAQWERAPFLVLTTDAESDNRLITTSPGIRSGVSGAVLVRDVDAYREADAHRRYRNLDGSVVRTSDPVRRLSRLRLRIVLPDGSVPEPTWMSGSVAYSHTTNPTSTRVVLYRSNESDDATTTPLNVAVGDHCIVGGLGLDDMDTTPPLGAVGDPRPGLRVYDSNDVDDEAPEAPYIVRTSDDDIITLELVVPSEITESVTTTVRRVVGSAHLILRMHTDTASANP